MAICTDPINITASTADSRCLMIHQSEAIEALNNYFDLADSKRSQLNGLVVMPTGSGKTFTAIYWLLNSGIANGYRIVWLAHRQELIDQTNLEFRSQAPTLAEYGIKKLSVIPVSGMHLKMSQASRYDVNICSISSIANKFGYRFVRRMLGTAGLEKLIVVIDEAHHAVSPSYQKVLKRITDLNPNRILLGLTATPTRMNKYDYKHLQDIFDVPENKECGRGTKKGYIYEVTLKKLLLSGFLANPIYKRIETNIVGEVEYQFSEEDETFFNKFGDFSEKMKSQIAQSSSRNQLILKQYLDNKETYGKTLIFAVNQLHCKTLYEEFKKAGVSCEYVISDKPGAQQTIADFKANKFDVLINVQILTEGSDVPNIQTVFLTRQTNSDSLLMQMIGRGLRGPAAGGTKDAFIIDFHDTWDKFSFWLDPQQLDIFDNPDEVEEIDLIEDKSDGSTQDKLVISVEKNISEIFGAKPDYTLWDVYLKLYNTMKANLLSKEYQSRLPIGWYSVLDVDGQDVKVLVYENQLIGFKELEKDKDTFKGKNASVSAVLRLCFYNDDNVPRENELKLVLDMLYENREMPQYYTFEQRDLLDAKEFAKKMNMLFTKDAEKEEWLKKVFDNSPILQELYKLFYVFKKTVFGAAMEIKESNIESLDERKEYKIVANYYNVEELLDEVLTAHDFLNKDDLLSIEWSNEVVKGWFALCRKWEFEDGTSKYKIIINKQVSSPDVDREVIKYLIYHELLHKNGHWNHDTTFRELEWQYPESDELDGFLDEIVLRYKLDIPLRAEQYSENLETEKKVIEPTCNQVPEKAKEPLLTNEPNTGIVSDFKYCRTCGNKLPSDANFCDKCGSKSDY